MSAVGDHVTAVKIENQTVNNGDGGKAGQEINPYTLANRGASTR
jgi:hypothetical protein